MMTAIMVYMTSWCAACKSELPKIRESANKLGYSVSVVNIEKCPVNLKPKCESVDFVPHVELNGKPISVDQLRNMASKR